MLIVVHQGQRQLFNLFPVRGAGKYSFRAFGVEVDLPPPPGNGNVEVPTPGTKTPRITNTRNTYSSPSAGNPYSQSGRATVSQLTYNQ